MLDFIQFLELKKERHNLITSSQMVSERSFEKIWANEEDAVYDSL